MRLVALVAAWVAGLLLGLEIGLYLWALALFSVAAVSLAGLLKLRGLSPWLAILAVIILIGLIRVEVSEGPEPLKASTEPRPITVVGLVSNDPELSGRGVEFVLSVDSIDRGEGREQGEGKLLVFARPTAGLVQAREEPYFRYGDRLELKGRLEEPPALGNFDYGAYLASQGIHSTLAFPQVRLVDEGEGNAALGAIYDLRHEVSDGIDRALPEPQAALAQALLLGIRGRLPRDVTDDFRSTGTSHLLAISGLHVGTLLFMSLGIGAWLVGRRRQLYLLLPLGTIWLYALLSGLSPSAERAAIMGSVYLLALALGRPRSALPTLALAAGVMAGVDPTVLKQVSFQLSFTAVAGIAMLTSYGSPLWSRVSGPSVGPDGWRSALVRYLVAAAAVSIAATVATLPLIAFNFQRVPTLGVLATVLTLPALPFLLATSALAAVAGMAHPVAGQVMGWFAWVPLEYVIWIVQLFAKVPGSTVSAPAFNGLLVWAYYIAFAVLLLLPRGPSAVRRLLRWVNPSGEGAPVEERASAARPRLRGGISSVAVVVLFLFTGSLWYYVATKPDGRLHVHFLDVGQGDSVLIVTPGGGQVLVDGGPAATSAALAVGKRTPFWDRDLNMVVLTHPDEDHFRGLVEVLERYDVELVLEGSRESENPLYLEWEKVLDRKSTRRLTAFEGRTLLLDDGARLEVLNPPVQPIRSTGSETNNNSVVLRLAYGGVSFLLTADIEAEAEARLLQEGLVIPSAVLKVPHHGSKTSSTPRFLSTVAPVAAVISAGLDNQYGHPHPEVMDRLEVNPGRERTYLTAERGDVEFITDGKRLWVKTER